jgi:DNA mismatch repair ATPase MutS
MYSDVERSLTRIHFGRCTPLELHSTLTAFEKIGIAFKQCKGFDSPLLNTVLALPEDFLEETESFLAEINADAAKNGDKNNIFVSDDRFPEISRLKKVYMICTTMLHTYQLP